VVNVPDIVLDKDKVKRVISDIESKNGTKIKDFSAKEIIILFHNDTQSKIKEIDIKLDKHIAWGQTEDAILTKALADHDILMQKITNILPEKGFCEKVSHTLYPDPPALPLDQKVELLWHDRRWVRYILYAVLGVGGINVFIQVVI